MLCGLQLWAVRRLEDQPNSIRDFEVLRAVPALAVELEHDAFAVADANRP
jgi:hypothetical protein